MERSFGVFQWEPGRNLNIIPCSLTLPPEFLLILCQKCLALPVLRGPELEYLLNDPDGCLPNLADVLNNSDTESPVSASRPEPYVETGKWACEGSGNCPEAELTPVSKSRDKSSWLPLFEPASFVSSHSLQTSFKA